MIKLFFSLLVATTQLPLIANAQSEIRQNGVERAAIEMTHIFGDKPSIHNNIMQAKAKEHLYSQLIRALAFSRDNRQAALYVAVPVVLLTAGSLYISGKLVKTEIRLGDRAAESVLNYVRSSKGGTDAGDFIAFPNSRISFFSKIGRLIEKPAIANANVSIFASKSILAVGTVYSAAWYFFPSEGFDGAITGIQQSSDAVRAYRLSQEILLQAYP